MRGERLRVVAVHAANHGANVRSLEIPPSRGAWLKVDAVEAVEQVDHEPDHEPDRQAEAPEQAATKRCSRCRRVKPVSEFAGSPATCDTCRTNRREAKAEQRRQAKAAKTKARPGNGAAPNDTASSSLMQVSADQLAAVLHVGTDAVASTVAPFIESGLVKARADDAYDIDRAGSREIANAY
jgi:hypothetical protein